MVRHYYIQGSFVCVATNKRTKEVYTDHGRSGVLNSCEFCNEKKNIRKMLHNLEAEISGKSNS